MPRNYNFIYKKLVKGKADIIGHIAYALYKDEKIAYIENFKKEKGKDPNELDLKPFNDISSAEQSIAKYKFMAQHILQKFLDNSLKEAVDEIEENCTKNHLQLVEEIISPLKPPSCGKQYLRGTIQGFLGALAFTIFMCAIIFIAKLSDTQYTFTFGGNGNAKLEETITDNIDNPDSTQIVTMRLE